jgi:hypothetical protein
MRPQGLNPTGGIRPLFAKVEKSGALSVEENRGCAALLKT